MIIMGLVGRDILHWIYYVVTHDCPILVWHNWQYADLTPCHFVQSFSTLEDWMNMYQLLDATVTIVMVESLNPTNHHLNQTIRFVLGRWLSVTCCSRYDPQLGREIRSWGHQSKAASVSRNMKRWYIGRTLVDQVVHVQHIPKP